MRPVWPEQVFGDVLDFWRWRYTRGSIALVLLCTLSGCSSGGKASCDKQQEYQASGSIEPLQVPDDMDQPDRSSALSIPELSSGAKEGEEVDPCLEAPPDYFGR
jgi:uncharacterized lipoprotein